jgi:hypothetical protein
MSDRAQPPADRSLTPLFRTESGALYAQDVEGRIYRNGQPEASGPLIAIDAPESPDGRLAVGRRAFLLMSDPERSRFGWRITTWIVALFAAPVLTKFSVGRRDERRH